MTDPKVYIVILNYRQWEDTRDCLASVLDSGYEQYKVLVVDNHSQNHSLENLVQWLDNRDSRNISARVSYVVLQKTAVNDLLSPAQLPEITFIRNDSNEGFAAGNNLALRILQQEEAYIWLLNPDMVVEKNTLAELVRHSLQQTCSCIVGATVKSYQGNRELLFYGGGRVNFLSATVSPVTKAAAIPGLDYISGACLFTPASTFKKTGLLPEDYFLYWEETDWCYRAKLAGFRLSVCTTAICYDKISTVIGKSFAAHYYYARNGLLFISKFRKQNIPAVLLFMIMRFLKRAVTGQWSRARGIYKGTRDFLKQP